MGNCASSEAVYADAGTAVQKESVKAQRAVYMSMCSKCFEYRIFDRKTIEGVLETIEVNNTDYLFKMALQKKNLLEVKEILSKGSLCGHTIVNYLKE